MTDHDHDSDDEHEPIFEPLRRFAMVPEWLLLAPGVTSRAIHVYAVLLATWANRSRGNCWPGRRTVAARMGISVDTFDRAIRELVELGAVIVEPRYAENGARRSNKLWLTDEDPRRKSAAPPPPRKSAEAPAADPRPQEPESQEPDPPHVSREVHRAPADAGESRKANGTIVAKAIAAAADRELAAVRSAGTEIRNPSGLRSTIIARLNTEHHDRLTELAAANPELDALTLAETIPPPVAHTPTDPPPAGVTGTDSGLFAPGSGEIPEFTAPTIEVEPDPTRRHEIASGYAGEARAAMRRPDPGDPSGPE